MITLALLILSQMLLQPSGHQADKTNRSDVMPVQLICPNLKCRKILAVPDEFRGKAVKCQFCQSVLKVPAIKIVQAPAPATKGKEAGK